jgi:hypothetical protein
VAELFSRGERGWIYTRFEGRDAGIPLDALGISLPMAELYRDVPAAPGVEPEGRDPVPDASA